MSKVRIYIDFYSHWEMTCQAGQDHGRKEIKGSEERKIYKIRHEDHSVTLSHDYHGISHIQMPFSVDVIKTLLLITIYI